eukprot:gene14197-30214_t
MSGRNLDYGLIHSLAAHGMPAFRNPLFMSNRGNPVPVLSKDTMTVGRTLRKMFIEQYREGGQAFLLDKDSHPGIDEVTAMCNEYYDRERQRGLEDRPQRSVEWSELIQWHLSSNDTLRACTLPGIHREARSGQVVGRGAASSNGGQSTLNT